MLMFVVELVCPVREKVNCLAVVALLVWDIVVTLAVALNTFYFKLCGMGNWERKRQEWPQAGRMGQNGKKNRMRDQHRGRQARTTETIRKEKGPREREKER